MEKRNNWKVGDYIYHKKIGVIHQIIEIYETKECTSVKSKQLTENGLYPIGDIFDDYLMFMDRYWINLGNSKYWRILYETKNKDSTNQLLDKSK